VSKLVDICPCVNVDDLADMKRRLEDCNRNKKQQLQQGDDDDDKQKPDRDQDNQVQALTQRCQSNQQDHPRGAVCCGQVCIKLENSDVHLTL